MEATGPRPNKRSWLLVVLALIGVLYCVLATWYWMLYVIKLVPLMNHYFSLRLLFGPFWFAVVLIPITIVVALLRVRPFYAALTIAMYLIVMCIANVAIDWWSNGYLTYGLLLANAINFWWNFWLQLPVWALTWLAITATRALRDGTKPAQPN